MRKKILIADDEADIVSMLRAFFESKGYFVLSAVNGTEALKQVEQEPDIILLDINMPGLDGLKVCERIRDYVSCPILFLTARIEDTDKVKGFAVGGDDYIVKPFSLMELEARVTAHLRREARRTFDAQIKFSGDLTVDYSERCLFFEGQRLGLAKKEFDIVELLSQNPGQVFTKERIYERIWGYDSMGDSSVVAEHIRRIRSKIAAYNEVPACELFIDRSFILQVCNNLLANAVRYARTSITLSFSIQNKGLLIMVLDDGKGFDKNIVHKVTNPYFTEEDRAEHFGLGLYICRLLCEHHGGYLNIDNTPNGAMVSAFFKNLSL